MIMDYKSLEALCVDIGFSHIAPLDMATLKPQQDVRAMCEVNRCGMYGKCLSCPPSCGTLEECIAEIRACKEGILVQTVGELEDEFDGEAMMETEHAHKAHFRDLVSRLRGEGLDILPLGSGACGYCKTCAGPDAPCRFPDKRISSVEAYGILVLQLCKDNNMTYFYGKDRIAYTSCVLLK